MTLTRRVTRSSVRSATAQATFSTASYSPRRLRSSPHNNSNTSASRSRATRSVSRPSRTTSSDHANSDESNHLRRHSTRLAAVQARDRISAASLPQRAARGTAGASRATDSSLPPRPGSLKSPIVLDDDDDDEKLDSKPAALPTGANPKETVAAALGNNLLADFTCAICLDCPATCEEVAKISGCTHRFCFDCIDKWAKTENRCPCCKARFRTIERVVPLSEVEGTVAALPSGRGRKRKARRGQRERFRSPAVNRATPAAAASAQVNSRTVEDRNQPVAGMAMSQETVQHIIETLRRFRREQNIGDGGNIQVQFMGGQRQPIIQIRSPSGAGGRVAGSQVQMLEFVMNLSGGEGGARTLSLTQIRGTGANGAAGRRGSSPRPAAAAARGAFNAAGANAFIAPFHMGSNGGTNRNERRRRPVSTTRTRGSSAATSSPSIISDVEIATGNGRTLRVGARSSPRTRSGRSPDQPVVLDE